MPDRAWQNELLRDLILVILQENRQGVGMNELRDELWPRLPRSIRETPEALWAGSVLNNVLDSLKRCGKVRNSRAGVWRLVIK